MRLGGNEYSLREAAGAFGDLGTLVPFAVGYMTIAGLPAQGVLLGFGLVAIVTGLYFRTPMPVQPMKAIATTAIANPQIFAPAAIWMSALVTGALWLAMALTGAVSWLAALTARPVVRGLVLGLGLMFMVEGIRLMQGSVALALVGLVLTFVMLGQRRLPAMVGLLLYGSAAALLRDPTLAADLSALSPVLRVPSVGLPAVTWNDLIQGAVLLALPQAALTLGNAVIATAEEHNALFPDRPVTVRRLALDHALMNFGAAAVGGVPMCRGAGGMAGHIRFGARTGGALVMLGIVLCTVGLFFADSVSTLFRLFPMSILGVILFFGGLELAAGVSNEGFSHEERVVLVVTAAFALWNMGLGYLAGLIVYHAWRRGLVSL